MERYSSPISSSSSNRSISSTNSNSKADTEDKESMSNTNEASNSKSVVKKKKTKNTQPIKLNLSFCKYEILRLVANHFNFVEAEEDDNDWALVWSDTTLPFDLILNMKGNQRCNHFPGMNEITRKDTLGRNLRRLQKVFPQEFDYFPKTFTLPSDYGELRNQFAKDAKKKTTYIVKPEASSQGKGIFLTRSLEDMDPMAHIIVQEYLCKPLLVDQTKFDLRIYVLVTSCDPLRIYLYREGLARFATEPYVAPTAQNLDQPFMHLTNYSINKMSDKFVENEDIRADCGTKRSIQVVLERLKAEGYDTVALWKDVADVIIKTVVAIQPKLSHIYSTCFPNDSTSTSCCELLGFDIILEKTNENKIKAVLLEVNHSPSLNMDTPIDRELKFQVLTDIMKILNVPESYKKKTSDEKSKVQDRLRSKSARLEKKEEDSIRRKEAIRQITIEEEERSRSTGFDRIFPCEDEAMMEKYASLVIPVVLPETVASQARRESIQRQQEEKERKEQEHIRKSQPKRKVKVTPDPIESDIEGHSDRKATLSPGPNPNSFDFERKNGVYFPVNSVQYQLQKARQQEAFLQKQNTEAMLLKRQQYDAARINEKYQSGKLMKQNSAPNVLSHESSSSNVRSVISSSPDVVVTLKPLSLSNSGNTKFQNQMQKRILPMISTSPELKSPSSDSNSYDPFQSMLQVRSMGFSNRFNK